MMKQGDEKMNWNGKDAALFQQQKEYIDTVIVPLVQADFGTGMMQSAEQYEFVQLVTVFLERQFKGRMLVAPPHTYLSRAENAAGDVKLWSEQLQEAGFKHVFYFTSDSRWRDQDQEINGSVIWVPSVPLGDMDDRVKYSIIENQSKQIVNIIVGKWQGNAG